MIEKLKTEIKEGWEARASLLCRSCNSTVAATSGVDQSEASWGLYRSEIRGEPDWGSRLLTVGVVGVSATSFVSPLMMMSERRSWVFLLVRSLRIGLVSLKINQQTYILIPFFCCLHILKKKKKKLAIVIYWKLAYIFDGASHIWTIP